MADKSLYDRLGGMYAIAAVIDRFSDQLLKNQKVINANPELELEVTGRLPWEARLDRIRRRRNLAQWIGSAQT